MDRTGDGALRAALIIAAAGSALILLGFFGTAGRAIGLAAAAAGTVVAAPYSARPGAAVSGWWAMLAAGCGLALAGTAISIGIDSLGGLVAVIGGALLAVGAAMGYPARR